MNLVVRIGGSVIASPLSSENIRKFADVLKILIVEGHKVLVVVGGGAFARNIIRIAKELGLDEKTQDNAAICASRIVAKLLSSDLGKLGFKKIPVSVDEAVECLKQEKIVVMGGLKPGMTTDTVAALIAEKFRADLFLKVSNQEGVYTEDPLKSVHAEKIDKISYKELSKLFVQKGHEAGAHQILESEAIRILRRNRIKSVVVSGFTPENILSAIKCRNVGTKIFSDLLKSSK